jgi:O-antigen/teichoic acid export membrane protein
MDRVAIAAVCGQVAQFVLTAVLAVMHSSLVVFTIPAVLCEIVIVAFKLRWIRPLQRVRYVLDTHRWKEMLRESIPLAVGGGLASAYYSIDAVMLSKMDTFSAVGTYGIAYKFAGVVSFLPLAVNAAVLTLLARSWPSDLATFRHSLQRAGTTMLLIAFLIVVEFGLFSEQAIRLLYGVGYVPATNATRLVMAGECVAFFTTLAVTAYAAMSKNRLYPFAALAGVVFNVGVNLVLIPRYSFRGAAWATLATESIVATVLWIPFVRRHGYGAFSGGVLVKGAMGGIVAAGVGFAALEVMPWIAAGVLVAVAYLALLHLIRVPDRGGLVSLIRSDELPPFVADT